MKMQKWYKINEDDPWNNNELIGLVAGIDEYGYTTWFSKAFYWAGGQNSIEDWSKTYDNFHECSEEKAMTFIKAQKWYKEGCDADKLPTPLISNEEFKLIGGKFEICWCETCKSYYVKCPRCGNNCCNGGYGDNGHCDFCKYAYEFQDVINRILKERDISPSFEKSGDLSDDTAEKIEKWPYTLMDEIWDYIDKCWNHEYGKIEIRSEVREIHFSTGGWRDNELIIDSLHKNSQFWHVHWLSSHKGGRYIFRYPESLLSNEVKS
ncbi:MAG: hypothetical protein WC119_00395 [Synergistaceae bacterium]